MTRIDRRLRQYLRRDLWAPDHPRGPLARLRDGVVRIVVAVFWGFQDSALNLHAMSLVYTTLLSLVPMLAVTFSVLKAFGAHYRIEPLLAHALEPLGPTGSEITTRLVGFVDNLQVSVLGTLGLVGLFYTVVSLVSKVEDALNYIWRVRRPRGLARRFTDYLSIVLVGPVLVFTAFALLASAQSYWLVRWLFGIAPEWAVVFVTSQVLPLMLLAAAFTFIYRFVPHTRVAARSAAVGGITAAILWQLAGLAFAKFVAASTQYTAIYSGFAILIVFLIWLDVAWLIVLVGGEVAYAHQHPAAYLAARRPHGFLHRERVALQLLAEITRRHLAGQPPISAAALARQLEAPLSTVEDLAEDLVRRHILLRTVDPEGLALARPPETVTIAEVFDIIRDPAGEDALQPGDDARDTVTAVLRTRDRAVQEALTGMTLRTLAADPPTLQLIRSA